MLPFSTISESFEDIARYGAVYCLMAFFFVADVIAIPNPFDWLMAVPFMVIAIYYWSIYRPAIMPPLLAFIAGLILDILSGAPFGLNAMIFVLLQWAMADQRAFLSAQSFPMIWLVFAFVFTGIIMVQWFVTGLLNLGWISLSSVLPEIGAGIIIFPLMALILHLIHKILPNMKMSLSSR